MLPMTIMIHVLMVFVLWPAGSSGAPSGSESGRPISDDSAYTSQVS